MEESKHNKKNYSVNDLLTGDIYTKCENIGIENYKMYTGLINHLISKKKYSSAVKLIYVLNIRNFSYINITHDFLTKIITEHIRHGFDLHNVKEHVSDHYIHFFDHIFKFKDIKLKPLIGAEPHRGNLLIYTVLTRRYDFT